MAEIFAFPSDKARKSYRQQRPERGWYQENGVRLYRNYQLIDLAGERPRGHPELSCDPQGMVLLATGQVWVEIHNQDLWVIRRLEKRPSGNYLVYLSMYRRRKITLILSEIGFRQSMLVWEHYLKFNQETAEILRSMFEGDLFAPGGTLEGMTE